ncbi:MAG: S8 family serine peptidase [candidate division Zixibacteria bacterium]|nr:S8 family serine peptidase [candidate division Zixibacteria bacterium]
MRSLSIIFCAVLVLFSLQGIQGGEQNVAEDLNIRLKADTFDSSKEQPDIPQALKLTTPNNYYLIQCAGPIQPEWINQLENRGIVILGYIPDYAYVVHMEEATKALVEQFSFVRWTGFYHPAYKIDPRLDLSGGDIELNVVVFRENGGDENLSEATKRIKEMGGEIVYDGKDNLVLIVEIDASKIDDIAFIPEVKWIDESFPKVTCMDNVRAFTGADTVHTCGFDGSGIVGGVKDVGFDEGHPDFAGQILAIDGNPPKDAHGTCVFGILFSSGANNEQAKGMLPNAQGVFCQWGVSRITSIAHLDVWGGVFQSNSWTQGEHNAEYTSLSEEDDWCVFYHDKISMLWPAGNSGSSGPQSLYPDAAAKNVISVGAVNHYDDTIRTNDEWGSHPGGQLGSPSYGPAADGRVKPDLCGPYEHIYTTDSRDGIAGDDGYRIGNYVTKASDGMFGGTSAATAVVAGAAGILYQMYQENLFGNNPSGDTPHASTVKALLIVDAYQYEFAQATRYQQGWGLPDLQKTLDIAGKHFIVDEETALQTGESIGYSFTPEEGSPLKISLVWTDPPAMPGADPALVNDLNLKVTAPDATVYWGNYGLESSHWSASGGAPDSLNNVENVFVENPQLGQWTIEVIAANIAQDGHVETPEVDQDFALVATTIPPYTRGDCNGDGVIDLGDVVYLINYLFKGGSAPDPLEAGDCNCDTVVDLGDVVYLINYLFKNGPPPCCP